MILLFITKPRSKTMPSWRHVCPETQDYFGDLKAVSTISALMYNFIFIKLVNLINLLFCVECALTVICLLIFHLLLLHFSLFHWFILLYIHSLLNSFIQSLFKHFVNLLLKVTVLYRGLKTVMWAICMFCQL